MYSILCEGNVQIRTHKLASNLEYRHGKITKNNFSLFKSSSMFPSKKLLPELLWEEGRLSHGNEATGPDIQQAVAHLENNIQ